MKLEDQYRECGILDGCEWTGVYLTKNGRSILPENLCYDTYNAVIPLIQMQDRKTLATISLMFKGQNSVAKNVEFMIQTPDQLRELLLKAKGLWK